MTRALPIWIAVALLSFATAVIGLAILGLAAAESCPAAPAPMPAQTAAISHFIPPKP